MINANLEQFLDTGWFSESTLYYNGFIYWCEAQYYEDSEEATFFVDKWAVTNKDNIFYHTLIKADGTFDWIRVYEIKHSSLDWIKKAFLQAPIFDGKSFWQIEKQIAWLDEGEPELLS